MERLVDGRVVTHPREMKRATSRRSRTVRLLRASRQGNGNTSWIDVLEVVFDERFEELGTSLDLDVDGALLRLFGS